MAKKDKKSKSAEQKARVAAKQTRKATQKEKKAKAKGGGDSDAEDIDLQAVLEEYSRQVCVLYIEYESPASQSGDIRLINHNRRCIFNANILEKLWSHDRVIGHVPDLPYDLTRLP